MSHYEYTLVASESMDQSLSDNDSEDIDGTDDKFVYFTDANANVDAPNPPLILKDLPPLPSDTHHDTENQDADETEKINLTEAKSEQKTILPGTLPSLNMTIKTYADATNIATMYPELAPTVLTMPLASITLLPKPAPPAPAFQPYMPAHTNERPNWALAPDPEPELEPPVAKRAVRRTPKISTRPFGGAGAGEPSSASSASSTSWAPAPPSVPLTIEAPPPPPMVDSDRTKTQGSSGSGYDAKYNYGLNYYNNREFAPTPPYMGSLPGSKQNSNSSSNPNSRGYRDDPPHHQSVFGFDSPSRPTFDQFDYVPPSADAWDVPNAGAGARTGTSAPASASAPIVDQFNYVPPPADAWDIASTSVDARTASAAGADSWQSDSMRRNQSRQVDAWGEDTNNNYHNNANKSNSNGNSDRRVNGGSRDFERVIENRHGRGEDINDAWTGSLPASAYGAGGGSRNRDRDRGGRDRQNYDQADSQPADDGWNGSLPASAYGAEGRNRGRDTRNHKQADSRQPEDDGWSGSLPASAYGAGGRKRGRDTRNYRQADSRQPEDDGWNGSLPASAYGAGAKNRGRRGRDRRDQADSRQPEDDGWNGYLPASAHSAEGGARDGRDQADSYPAEDDGWNGSLPAFAYGARGRNRGGRDGNRQKPNFGDDEGTTPTNNYNDDQWTGSLPASAYGASSKKSKGREGRRYNNSDSNDYSRGQRDNGRDAGGHNPPDFNNDFSRGRREYGRDSSGYNPLAQPTQGSGGRGWGGNYDNADPYTPQIFEDGFLPSCDPSKWLDTPAAPEIHNSNHAFGNRGDYYKPHDPAMWLPPDSNTRTVSGHSDSAAAQDTDGVSGFIHPVNQPSGFEMASSDAMFWQGAHDAWTAPQSRPDVPSQQQQLSSDEMTRENRILESFGGHERRRSVSPRESQVAAVIAATHRYLFTPSPSGTPPQAPTEAVTCNVMAAVDPEPVPEAANEPMFESPTRPKYYSPDPSPQRQGRSLVRTPPKEVRPSLHQERSPFSVSSFSPRPPSNLSHVIQSGESSPPRSAASPARAISRSVVPSPARSVVSPARSGAFLARSGAPSPAGVPQTTPSSPNLFRDVHIRINTPPPSISNMMGLSESRIGAGESLKSIETTMPGAFEKENVVAKGAPAANVVKTPVIDAAMPGAFEKENAATVAKEASAINVPLPHEFGYAMNSHAVAWTNPNLPPPEA